jgi:hypothetical protein
MVHDNKFNSTIKKMAWLFDAGPHESQKKTIKDIVKLGKLLAHLRGAAPTWQTRDTQGSNYAYGIE